MDRSLQNIELQELNRKILQNMELAAPVATALVSGFWSSRTGRVCASCISQ